MDGSVVIGVSMNTAAFEAALTRLRNAAVQTVSGALQPLTRSIGSLQSTLSSSTSGVRNWSGQFRSAFLQVQNGAAALAGTMGTTGRRLGQNLISGVVQINGAQGGRRLAQQVLQGFSGVNFRVAGVTAVSGIQSGLSAGSGGISRRAGSLAASVKSAFSGGWYTVGWNISSGIASGLWGGSYLISNAAWWVAQNALSTAKRSLGIRSPSRVFREQVGRMIPAGIAEGVKAGEGRLLGQVTRQSRIVTRQARQQVAPRLTALPGGVPAPVTAGTGQVHVTVETPLYLDSREVARATARQMQRQMLWESM